jgi:hypothetical protein
MNMKILVQRLVNVVHSRAKASLALIEMDSGTFRAIKLGRYCGFVRLGLRHRDKGASCLSQRRFVLTRSATPSSALTCLGGARLSRVILRRCV